MSTFLTISSRPRKAISPITTRPTKMGRKFDHFFLFKDGGDDEYDVEGMSGSGNSSDFGCCLKLAVAINLNRKGEEKICTILTRIWRPNSLARQWDVLVFKN